LKHNSDCFPIRYGIKEKAILGVFERYKIDIEASEVEQCLGIERSRKDELVMLTPV
jgi:hypothetical protein